ncbi:proline-rich proteoglycan 2-like [Molothrus ater]|uniref:proline-rich proteoglycan 2-like n=1 Tax=Molothrus ater TaxID=84834 RepID=UPI0023E7AA5D|nr:proline-rich proteoglycan 2-like [Molothrus ater]
MAGGSAPGGTAQPPHSRSHGKQRSSAPRAAVPPGRARGAPPGAPGRRRRKRGAAGFRGFPGAGAAHRPPLSPPPLPLSPLSPGRARGGPACPGAASRHRDSSRGRDITARHRRRDVTARPSDVSPAAGDALRPPGHLPLPHGPPHSHGYPVPPDPVSLVSPRVPVFRLVPSVPPCVPVPSCPRVPPCPQCPSVCPCPLMSPLSDVNQAGRAGLRVNVVRTSCKRSRHSSRGIGGGGRGGAPL